MPRRKKAPPQDMDVDSDDDNVTKQKKATEKFMALLKPIKDAALAFDVDVDEALEDYVEACVRYVEKDAGAMINFAEAGLLLQGSAVVYGRKVDGVHALVYRVLELLRTGQKEKEKAEKKAAARSRRPAVPSRHRRDSCPSDEVVGGFFFDFEAIRTASRPRCPAQEGPNEEEESDEEEPLDPLPENALAPLKPCRPGKNIDLDEEKEKEIEHSDVDPLIAMLFRDTDEDAPFFGACFCEDGSLRLPGLEGDGALDEEGQEGGTVSASKWRPSYKLRLLDGVGGSRDTDSYIHAGARDEEAPAEAMMDVEPLPPLVEEDDGGFAPPPMDDDDGFAPGGDDDDVPFQAPVADEEEEEQVPQDDPWEELDPLADDSKPRPLKRGRTWRAPPEDGDTVELPSHLDEAPSDAQVAALCAAEASAKTARDRKLATKSLNAALKQRAAVAPLSDVIPELLAAVALEEKRARQADDEESVEDAWDGRGRRATFARLFSDEIPLQPQVEEEDDQSFGGPIGGFDDDYDDACDADVVQEACQQHLDELAGAVASYAQLARIADRVAQWQERLAPILAAQEAGPPFDILALGRDVVAAVAAARARDCRVQGEKPSPVMFAQLARGRERSGVCRQFLATLQLANNGNVLLGHAHKADVLAPVSAFTVDLLTESNAHENLKSGAFTRVGATA